MLQTGTFKQVESHLKNDCGVYERHFYSVSSQFLEIRIHVNTAVDWMQMQTASIFTVEIYL